MMDRSHSPVRKTTRAEQRPPERVLDPVEAWAMMWPLACDAWAMRGEPVDESRLLRHVVRVIRGRG